MRQSNAPASSFQCLTPGLTTQVNAHQLFPGGVCVCVCFGGWGGGGKVVLHPMLKINVEIGIKTANF